MAKTFSPGDTINGHLVRIKLIEKIPGEPAQWRVLEFSTVAPWIRRARRSTPLGNEKTMLEESLLRMVADNAILNMELRRDRSTMTPRHRPKQMTPVRLAQLRLAHRRFVLTGTVG